MVLWIIGMTGAGKSTLANIVYADLKNTHPESVLLDGDSLRSAMGNDLGYSIADRHIQAVRLSRLSLMLAEQKIHVIAPCISIFKDIQEWNRAHIPGYFEVYLKVSFQVLKEQRDIKGLYQKALQGLESHVVGVDIDFPEPVSPDMVIDNDTPLQDLNPLADLILKRIKPFH